jgi:hypothetical protein
MKDNNISVRNYTSLNGIESPNLLTPEIMEQTIVDNFEKGKITEELFLGSMNILEKGKRGVVGEIREWSGKKYQKTATGWTPVKEGVKKKELPNKEFSEYVSSVKEKQNQKMEDRKFKEELPSEENITMDHLDWGKTAAERDKNLGKYISLKSEKEKHSFLKELKSKNSSSTETKEKEFSKVNLGGASRAENILSDLEDEGFKEGKDYKIGELHRGDDIPKSIIPLNEKAQKRLLELKSEY